MNELALPLFGRDNLEGEIVPLAIDEASIEAEVNGTQLNSFDAEVLTTLERLIVFFGVSLS